MGYFKKLLWLYVKCLQSVLDVNYYVYYCESCGKYLKLDVFITFVCVEKIFNMLSLFTLIVYKVLKLKLYFEILY